MRINTNVSAMNAWRHTRDNSDALSKSLERLSSGLRVNRASDDAAGLSISESLRAQVKGGQQAMRNAQDGISLAQVADGGLNEMHGMLQRMRELAVQAANATYGSPERQAMQAEVSQLIGQIDDTAKNTTFNGLQILSSSKFTDAERQQVLDDLQKQLLKDAWDTVATRYGITTLGSPNNLTVFLDDMDGAGGVLAYVSSAGAGPTPTLELHVDMSDFVGGGATTFNDRVIAHELTHAIMFDETNAYAMPTWFMEGAAEFVQGADDRVAGDLGVLGGNTAANRQTLLNRLSASSWGGTSADYSAGYVATKYLDEKLRNAGHAGGLKDAMTALQANPGWDMDDVAAMAGYADQNAFLTDVKANGAAWSTGWTTGHMTVGDADVGSIAGSSYGGPVMNSAASVANGPAVMPADWTPWTEAWPSTTAPGAQVTLQIGANYGQTLMLNTVSATSGSLGVGNVDLVGSAQSAISQIDAAIAKVSGYRASFGADQNRLEHTIASLGISGENQATAESRIRDTDMADEMGTFTRRQIMTRSATAMVAQANMKPRMLMSLLGA